MPNLSQLKRERMLEFLQKIKDEHRDDDDMLIALGEIESELTSKKYGLVWEQHEEAVDVMMRDNIPVFTEVPEREITTAPGQGYNFILEGDNLHSLRLLEKTHKGKIDLIYIDPPYNTGARDFRYDDSFVVKEDGFRHSKWISFMRERLVIAKNLLSQKGSIFISIDDNEEAVLKLLCDDIFGEDCFVANIAWQRTYSMRNDSKGIASEVEHILVYSKNIGWNPKKLERTAEMDSKYKNPDNDPNGAWRNIVASAPNAVTHQGMVYAIQNPMTGEYCYPPQGRCWALGQEQMLNAMRQWCEYELVDLHDNETRARICGVPVEQVRENVLSIVIKGSLEDAHNKAQEIYKRVIPEFFFSQKGKGALSRKAYINNMGGRPVTNFWSYAETGHTDEASRLLKTIFDGTAVFDTPKPPRLIERILHIATNDNSIILDFFAGSGTTGHAVLKYNAEYEGSHRQFILCTNNENNICEEVTYERVRRVIAGYSKTKGIPANVKYYRTDFVSKDDEYLSDALLEHIREMIQLEHGVKIDGSQYLMVMSDEEADELQAHWSECEGVKAIYASKEVLFTTEQNALFAGVEIHTIPDYYFNFELKEVGEAW